MARAIGPDEACRVVYLTAGTNKGKASAQGMPAPIYLDLAATTLADIVSTTDGVIDGSTVLVDAWSKIPLFKYPDGVDTLYTSINGGPVVPLYARTDDRLDALAVRVTAVESGSSSATTVAAADATAKANAAQAAAIAVSAQRASNLSDLASASAARTNLGLGGSAVLAVGTSAGTVAAGDAPAAAQTAAIAAAATDATTKVAAEANARTAADALLTPLTRTVSTAAPLTGGGDLSANRTFAVSNATTGAVGVVQLAGDLAGTGTAPVIATGAVTEPKTAAGLIGRLYAATGGVREVLANDPFFGTAGTRAAFVNALDAAEALGKHTIVRMPNGFVVDVVQGLSLSGYSVIPRGAGASIRSATAGTTIKASAQTGPALDFLGWVTPGQALGKVTIGGFMVEGDNTADATKNHSGMRVDAIDGVTFADIAIRHTGGPALDISQNSPGDGCYLSDFERFILNEPVGVVTNDVPWLRVVSANCNRFRSFGFRAVAVSNTGLSGAIYIDDDGTNPVESNFWDAFWFENLTVQPNGTLINVKAFKNVFADFQFIDVKKQSATGTTSSYFRLREAASNGGVEIRGNIPGGSRNSTDVDMGVDVQSINNRISGTKGDGSNNVVIASGKGGNYVELQGRNRGALGVGVVDNSGLTTNTLIDYQNATATYPAAMTATGGAGSGATPATTVLAASGSPQAYVVPAWAKTVRIRGIAGAGGSGSGARQPDGTIAGGGGSGGGGGSFDVELRTSDITSTIVIDVGLAGTAGASVTVDATNGNAGTAGSPTLVRDGTGAIYYARATGGGGGGAGTSTGGGGAGSGGVGQFLGADGVVGSSGATPGSTGNAAAGGAAGGGGGGISAANAAQAGGVGGYCTAGVNFAYTAANGNGTSVTPSSSARGGTAGGGGSSGSGTTAGGVAGSPGGNGGNWGCSGGGGSGSRNGLASGAAGVSTDGRLVITAY